jgi:membrane protease YdiL (CAAX protease family)
MFQSRLFWLLFFLISLGCAVAAFVYFPAAYPLVTLDLQMDREMALAASRSLSETHAWGPSEYRQAASFNLDGRVQNFVELEVGGTEGFRQMLAESLYSPYTWRVRHFKEGETLETWLRFTPNGKPYGFTQKLSEDASGASITGQDARLVAEEAAIRDWNVDLSAYELVESSQELRPGGRTDHTLVYRRREDRIGEGEYRLRLVVGGDRLTELTHFVKVPESFSRRYEEMRSANDAIAVVSSVTMVILYIVGGCIVGTFYLLRKRWISARQPIFWGFFISFLQVLAVLNQWPFLWMSYDTALAVQSYILNQIAMLLAMFLGMGLLLSLTFTAAEGLTRRAFGDHIRLWKLWSTPVAGTPAVAGRTLAGYLLVSVFFAYEVGLYFFSTHWLGWWTPSSALFDPNILATYFPWLTSIAISLQAGFWEECLFRAVPIAGAALIGERLGNRRAWIFGAFILQALIFGAAHANYPAQPAYARMVELIVPSLFFGWVYLRYGLLVAINLHFAFDVVWIAMPLFVSQAPGIWVDRFLVVLLTLVPLWVVLGARLRAGKWRQLSEEALNRTWQAPSVVPRVEEAVEKKDHPVLSIRAKRAAMAVGIALFGVWVALTDFHNEAPPLRVGRNEAMIRAGEELSARGIVLGTEWRTLVRMQAGVDYSDRFIWQEGGVPAYRDLLGSYLSPPRFQVRFARFEGDIAERAEEYQVEVGSGGEVLRFRHRVPEARPGARLTEDEARDLALPMPERLYGLDPHDMEEISAVPSNHPNRDDWVFTYADRRNYPLEEGEARIAIGLAGEEIVDGFRWIHVPEEWRRRDRDRATRASVVRVVCFLLVSVSLMAGVAGAVVAWSRKRFDVRYFLWFFALLAVLEVARYMNSWPTVTAQFSTAQPWMVQALVSVGVGVMALLVTAAAPALLIGFAHHWQTPKPPVHHKTRLWLGFALGAAAAGTMTVAKSLAAPSYPSWADYAPAATLLPVIEAAFTPLVTFVLSTALVLLLFIAVDRFTSWWTERRALLTMGLLLFGIAVVGLSFSENLLYLLVAGLVVGFFLIASYIGLVRFELSIVPIAVGLYQALYVIEEGAKRAYAAALPGAILAALLMIWISILWSGSLRESSHQSSVIRHQQEKQEA